jgi:adenosylcobinamide-GDP ribazoletransferase
LTSRAEPRGGLPGALALLTIVPLRRRRGLQAIAAWFPVVGALVGAAAGGVRLGLAPLLGRTPASVLAVAVLAGLTGALHLDGLADTFDGVGARGAGPQRRLAAMRDSSTGAFGVLAIVVWALLVVSALAPLAGLRALRALVAACAVGRWAALLHAGVTAPAGGDGLGATFTVSGVELAIAGAVAAGGAIALLGLGPGLAADAAAVLAAAALSGYARTALGGRTGDTLGATVAIAEAVALLVALGFWRA